MALLLQFLVFRRKRREGREKMRIIKEIKPNSKHFPSPGAAITLGSFFPPKGLEYRATGRSHLCAPHVRETKKRQRRRNFYKSLRKRGGKN